MAKTARRREWKRWHFFAIAAAAIAIIGGVWGVVAGGDPAPSPTPTMTVTTTP